jgi:DNA-binding GntR family transcriptional regulator
MQTLLEFNPRNISDQLVVAIRRMIVDGVLPPGGRINEVALSRTLGVSRTPLREALGRLTAEAAVSSVPRLGFFVRPLTIDEIEQIYPVRGLLDPAALRLGGIPARSRLDRLEELNRQMLAGENPEEVLTIDDSWHLELLAGCPNLVFIDLIKQFIWRTRRYELALMRERRNVVASTNDHERIIDALRANDLELACSALRQNMQSGLQPIIEWLRERQQSVQQLTPGVEGGTTCALAESR